MQLKLEYQNHNPKLEKLIKSIDRPGEFCTAGSLSCPMPTVSVDGVGILAFPTPEFQVKQLLKVADQAPYGKGSETLVDTSVRNCWEINPQKFSLGGRAWDETLQKVVSATAEGLGCNPAQLSAQLYKFLIYEKGGFFLPHQDTEKAAGMIATLTVSLPVSGTGGELVVRHKDNEKTIQLNAEEPSELVYAAFYADCEHEIKEVKSGHRISLVFNLCVAANDKKIPREAPDYTKKVDEIAAELTKWCRSEHSSDKLVWILEHQYSESGLAFSTLKNGDRAVAFALREAVKQVPECELYAAIVAIDELYDVFETGGGYYYQSDYSSSDYEINELIEAGIEIDDWVAVDDSRPKFGAMEIEHGELMPDGVLDHFDPDDEEFEGYTGNAGATLNLIYNLAALALFKRQRMMDLLSSRGPAQAVAWINEEIRQNDGKSSEHIRQMATSLVDRWPTAPSYLRGSSSQEMLKALRVIKDPDLSRSFLLNTAIREYEGNENALFLNVSLSLNPDDTHSVVLSLIQEQFANRPECVLDLLLRLDKKISKWGERRLVLLRECTEPLLKTFPEIVKLKAPQPYFDYGSKRNSGVDSATIYRLFVFLFQAQDTGAARCAVDILASYTGVDMYTRSLPKALKELQKHATIYASNTYSQLWQMSVEFMLERSEFHPEPPKDWRRDGKVGCSCELCQQLSSFLENPNEEVAYFAVNQELRGHLRGEINSAKLDVDYETIRQGRPYTLELIKNRNSYEQRLKEYAKDIKYFDRLLDTMPKASHISNKDELATRIHSAIKVAANTH